MTVDDIIKAKRLLKRAWYTARKDALKDSSCWVAPVAQGVRLYSPPLKQLWQREATTGSWRTA